MISLKKPAVWLALALPFASIAPSAEAAYQLCAFRDGPSGPCTCKSDDAAAGEFKVVSKRYCRTAKATEAPKPKNSENTNATTSVQETGAVTGTKPSAPAADAAAPSSAESEPATQAPPASEPASETPAFSIPASKKLIEVRARGKLLCGVNSNRLGFSNQTQAGEWAGIDAEFCRAVAAAIFGDATKVEFIALENADRFSALRSNKIDVLSRNTTWTMQRDIEEQVDFAGVLFFDGQGFLTTDDRGLVSAQQLAGTTLCVEQATTSEQNMAYYFKSHKINITSKAYPNHDAMLEAYKAGECDAFTGDRSTLFADRAALPEPDRHAILPEVISKEPLGPAVAKGDEEWAAIVRWTLAALINAEEVGLTKAMAAAKEPLAGDADRLVQGSGPIGEKLGLSSSWVRDIIAGVGNYGEVFETNVGSQSPLGMERGINALWKRGGLLYAPPMW